MNVRRIRKMRNMTQRSVAKRLGVVNSCYANWEQGRTEPNIEMLRKLAEIYCVQVDQLIKE